MAKRRALIFAVIAFTYIISYFHRAAPAVVGPIIATEVGLNPTQLGLIASMYFWAYALAVFPSGLLADGWGARNTIAAFVLFAAVGGGAFAFADGVGTLAASRFAIGLGVSAVYVAALRIFSDWYSPDELATYSGLLLAFGNVGALLSTAPLVSAIAEVGWRNVFATVAVLTFVAGIISYAVIRNSPHETPRGSAMARVKPASSGFAVLRDAITVVLSERRIYLLGGLLFSFYGTFMGVASLWAGPYLQTVYGMSKQEAGHILMLFPLGMTIGCPLAGYLSDKVFRSRRAVLLYGGLLHLLSYVPLVFFTADLDSRLLSALFLWYGLSGGAFVVCFACAKELYDGRYAGASVGALTIFLHAGGAFYQYVIGVLIGQSPLAGASAVPPSLYSRAFVVPMIGLAIGLVAFSRFREGATTSPVPSRLAPNLLPAAVRSSDSSPRTAGERAALDIVQKGAEP